MICTEYFPAYTHSDDPDCKNCKYMGVLYCTNVRVRQLKKQWGKQLKDNEQHRENTSRDREAKA